MKIAKILSAAAATVVAASALAATAGAELIAQEKGSYKTSVIGDSAQNFAIVPSATGEGDALASSLAADAGFTLDQIAAVSFTIQIPEGEEREYWVMEDNQISGGIVTSVHFTEDKSTRNWDNRGAWWGVTDEELGLATDDPEDANTLAWEALGNYTYKVTCPLPSYTEMADGLAGEFVQYRIFFQAYEQGMAQYNMTEVSLYDANGAVLATVDGQGNLLKGYGASAGNTGSTGSTETPKGSPDTGVEGIAAVAGLGVVAAGVAVMSKKRK